MDNVRFSYLRDQNGNAFACIAVRLNKDNASIEYGISSCNPSDKFDREIARNIAQSRLNKEARVIEFVRLDGMSGHEITRHVMYDLVCDRPVNLIDDYGVFTAVQGAPQRVREAAKNWLVAYISAKPVTVPVKSKSKFENMASVLESKPNLPTNRAVS